MVRGPPYTREKEVIQPGEFVLVKRPTLASLDVPSRPHVLQVVRTSDQGVMILQGQDGARIEELQKNLAPCSLPVVDKKIYPERYFSGDTTYCRECGSRRKEECMVLCDRCQQAFHTFCLTPPLSEIPLGAWVCPYH